MTTRLKASKGHALLKAANDGSAQEVQRLLTMVDWDFRDSRGRAALHYAASNGHLHIILILLKAGAHPEPTTDYGETPLHCAALNGHTKCVEALLAGGANVNAKDNWLKTPLAYTNFRPDHITVECKRVLILAGGVLRERNYDVRTSATSDTANNAAASSTSNTCTTSAVTATSSAAGSATPTISTSSILSSISPVPCATTLPATSSATSPAHAASVARAAFAARVASTSPHASTTAAAVAAATRFALTTSSSTTSDTSRAPATSTAHPLVASAILLRPRLPPTSRHVNRAALTEALVDAVRTSPISEIRQVLRDGPVFSSRAFTWNNMALHNAVFYGRADVVQLLLEAGAPLETKDNGGCTPLLIAASNGRLACLDALLTAGATLQAQDKFGNTPLHSAALCGHLPCVEMLLRAGAHPSAKNKDGQTPLDLTSDEEMKDLISSYPVPRAPATTNARVARRDLDEAIHVWIVHLALREMAMAGQGRLRYPNN